jgi:hypothetical protein
MLLAESIPVLLNRLQIRAQKGTHSILMSEFQNGISQKHACVSGGSQRDVVYLGWPMGPSYMSIIGGVGVGVGVGGIGGGLRGLSKWVQLCTWSPNKVLEIFLYICTRFCGLECVGQWPLLWLCRPFCIFERCLDSKPKQAHYHLSHPSPLFSHPSPLFGHPSPSLSHPSPSLSHPSPSLSHPSPSLSHSYLTYDA